MFRSLKTMLAATALGASAGLVVASSCHTTESGGGNGGGYGDKITHAITYITNLAHGATRLAEGEPGTGSSGGYGGKKGYIAYADNNTPGSGNGGGYGGK